MPYPLPAFISRTLEAQPLPPRRVPILAVIGAVLGGVDCAIYAGGSLILIVLGLSVMVLPSASSPPSDLPVGLVIVGLGVLCGLLAGFRIWQVDRALRHGDARKAEVVETGVGRARIYGTPWGEPMLAGGMLPIAARGTYRLDGTGECGKYYMQQWWAAALQPGAHIWVLRRGRDELFAPIEPLAPDVR